MVGSRQQQYRWHHIDIDQRCARQYFVTLLFPFEVLVSLLIISHAVLRINQISATAAILLHIYHIRSNQSFPSLSFASHQFYLFCFVLLVEAHGGHPSFMPPVVANSISFRRGILGHAAAVSHPVAEKEQTGGGLQARIFFLAF